MIESTLPLYPKSAETLINDRSCGLFNMFLGIGQVVGPIYGSTITKMYGFRIMCDLVSIGCLVYGIIYYVFGNGRIAFIKSRWEEISPE